MNPKEAPKAGGGSPLEFTMTHGGMMCGFADAATMERFQKAIVEAQEEEIHHLQMMNGSTSVVK